MPLENSLLCMSDVITLPGQPTPTLGRLCGHFRESVGFDQFTVTLLKPPLEPGGVITSGLRMYTTHPQTHPAVVEVPFGSDTWTIAMTAKQQPLVMNTVDDYRQYYDGWYNLRMLGYISAANLPVVVNRVTIGTINLLSRRESFFITERIAAAKQLHAASALAIMMCAHTQGVALGSPTP